MVEIEDEKFNLAVFVKDVIEFKVKKGDVEKNEEVNYLEDLVTLAPRGSQQEGTTIKCYKTK